MSKKIPIGVIGVGRLGSLHAKTYAQMESVDLVGVYDTDSARASEIANLYPNCQAYKNASDLIQAVEALTIATPTESHHIVSKEALTAGKHLLIEKPITTTLEDADELIQIAQEKERILQVGHIERFNSAIETVVARGDIPKFIECDRLGPFTPRVANVGVVIDLMIHDIDIILSLVNSPIESIDAVGIKILTVHEDIANARIRFQNGAIANLTASRVTPETLRKIRLFQENSYLSIDYVKQEIIAYRKNGTKIESKNYPIQKEEPIKKELTSFINSIQNNKTPIVSGKDGRNALAVALQIVDQINNGK